MNPGQLKNKIQTYEILSWLLLALAFIYTILRACYLGITHDEAVTYLYWASGRVHDILLYTGFAPPNNHLLNSLLIKLAITFFGLSEFTIRIPALIGHALYLVAAYKTLKLFLKEHLMVCGLCVLIFNPFMLQLFAIGRGYALGLGFSSIGIYFLLKYIKDQHDCLLLGNVLNERLKQRKDSSVFWGFLMFALATISTFTFFHLYLAALVWIVGYEIKIKRALGRLILPSLLLLLSTCLIPIIKIHASHHFIAEIGKEGFWRNTVLSLIDGTLYNQAYSLHWLMSMSQCFVIDVIVIAIVLVIFSLCSKEKIFQDPTFALLRCVSIWLMICCFVIVLEGTVIRFGYSEGRTAIYFIPLFYLLLLLVIQCFFILGQKIHLLRTGVNCFVVLLAFICLYHFIYCANLKSFYKTGAYEESSREAINYLKQWRKDEHLKDRSLSIGTHRNFTPLLNFYIIKDNVPWLKTLPYQEDLHGDFDYYYLSANNNESLEKSEMDGELKTALLGKNLKVIKVFADATYLARAYGLK